MNTNRAASAASRQDYEVLKCIAKEPGGFVDDQTRRLVWPVLLHAQTSAGQSASTEESPDRHPDAHQVQLDVDRSFNQPGWLGQDQSPQDLLNYRSRLTDLAGHVFTAHPALRYFQGLHDILAVVVLVFPEEQQDLARACATQLCLHHLRDHQTTTLNPSIGYLRLLLALLRQADPKLSWLVEEESNLPFFALSWVITWLSHDIESLSAVKRLFDLLLVMNPAFIVYVAAALSIMQSRTLNMKTIELGELQHFLGQLPRMRLSTRSPASSNSDSDLEIPSDMSTSFATSASSSSHPSHRNGSEAPKSESPSTAVDFEELLLRAQELWRRFPPQEIGLLEIFGSNSATRTWALANRIVADEEAEQIVREGKDIFKPEKEAQMQRRKPFWRSTQTLVLVSAVAGVLLAIYGPRLLQSRGKVVKPWLHVILDRCRGKVADGRWFLDRIWR